MPSLPGRAIAAGLLLMAMPGGVEALRVVKGSFEVSPSQVDLTRTITVSVTLEDNVGQGGYLAETLTAEPARLVRLVGKRPLAFSCSRTGVTRSKGEWIFEALAPGEVRFKLDATLVSCTLSEASPAGAISPAVTLLPPKVWSGLELTPKILAPGQIVTLALSLRNDSAGAVSYGLPGAQAELEGAAQAPVIPVSPAHIEPGTAIRDGRIVLAPAEMVKATWTFQAVRSGRTRFLISGAGIILMSPSIAIRHTPVLEVAFNESREKAAVGRVMTLEGAVGVRGNPGVAGPEVGLSWRPATNASLLESSFSSTPILEPNGSGIAASFQVGLLKPGDLEFTLSAWGREADTGNPLTAEPAVLNLDVLPPPELKLMVTPASATVIVGVRIPFVLDIANSGIASASPLTPVFAVETGKARFKALNPLFQAVPAGRKGRFSGSFVALSPGPVEFVARVSTRGSGGGTLVSFVSPFVRVLAVPAPRLALTARPLRLFPSRCRFGVFLRNLGPEGVRIEKAMMGASGGNYDVQVDVAAAGPLKLKPGETVTLYFEAVPSSDAAPYRLDGVLRLEGKTMLHGLGFERRFPALALAYVFPRARAFALMEPASPFRPPLDPVLSVEWTLTGSGRAGVVVVNAAGGKIRVLAPAAELEAGAHGALWDGRDAEGKLVAPGNYLIRMAGPAPDPAAWPVNAAWKVDRPVAVERP